MTVLLYFSSKILFSLSWLLLSSEVIIFLLVQFSFCCYSLFFLENLDVNAQYSCQRRPDRSANSPANRDYAEFVFFFSGGGRETTASARFAYPRRAVQAELACSWLHYQVSIPASGHLSYTNSAQRRVICATPLSISQSAADDDNMILPVLLNIL